MDFNLESCPGRVFWASAPAPSPASQPTKCMMLKELVALTGIEPVECHFGQSQFTASSFFSLLASVVPIARSMQELPLCQRRASAWRGRDYLAESAWLRAGDPLADSILDRLVHNAYRLDLGGESIHNKKGRGSSDQTQSGRRMSNLPRLIPQTADWLVCRCPGSSRGIAAAGTSASPIQSSNRSFTRISLTAPQSLIRFRGRMRRCFAWAYIPGQCRTKSSAR